MLQERQKGFRDETLRLSAHFCKRELDDPARIDTVEESTRLDYHTAFAHFDGFYAKTYNSARLSDKVEALLSTPARSRIATESLSGQLAQPGLSAGEGDQAPRMTTRERRECFIVMAGVTAWAVRGVLRLFNVVGRESQAQALDFLQEVMPTLRKGLGLERVERDVVVKSTRVLEPDATVVAQRLALRKRKRELMELR